MKIYLLLLVGFISLTYAHGQTDEENELLLDLKEHPQEDTIRVKHLNSLSRLATIPLDKRDSFALEAISISRKINAKKHEGYALISLANIKSSKGERNEAFQLLEQAQVLATEIRDKQLLGSVYFALGLNSQSAENKKALDYFLKALTTAEEIDNKKMVHTCERMISNFYQNSLTDYPKAMDWIIKSIKTAEEIDCLECFAQSWVSIASLYSLLGDHAQSLVYYEKAQEANRELGNVAQFNILNNIGERHRLMGNYPEAIKSYKQALSNEKDPFSIEIFESNLADVYVRMGDLPQAFKYAFSSLRLANKLEDTEGEAWIQGILARAYLKSNQPDSALYYASSGLKSAQQAGTLEYIRDNYGALANAYVLKEDYENAYSHQNLYINYRDSMLNAQVTNKSNLLQYNYDLEKKQVEITTLNQEKKLQNYLLIGALVVLVLIVITVFILLRNNRQKQKANNLLIKQKKLIEEQRDQTNKALAELQLTQSQLVQSEKMASLGELTAGIAHEIQNPLNFVNNFSEVNTELIDELVEEVNKANYDEARVLAKDIKENEQKIAHHGKRADAIVKGMLQHSRNSNGIKEPTDINALADEYLRLAYHGLRAKNKSFNAGMETDFDENIGVISVISQDIGRVILNLITNAFYAVSDKRDNLPEEEQTRYKPTVTVSTNKLGNTVEIKIKDNGNGIPQHVLNKVFEPFFTTKPTGQGTGLGLSMSYDIVTKAHNGKLEVVTEEGHFTTFTIILPIETDENTRSR